jgi:ribosomal protein L37E
MEKGEEEMVKKKIICPKCGQENLFPTKECVRCGSSFILFPELRGLFEKGEQRKNKIKEPISKTDDLKGEPLICPKCGQENDSLSLECSRCGIVFLKYYDIQAREETDEEKKAELLAKKEKEEEKTEALAKKKEEEERAEALIRKKEEEERAEALSKQKEEEEKAEALQRQKKEEEAEVLRRKKEEEEKTEALRRQKEQEERAEALRRQKEEEEKAEALRKQKEAEERAEALRRQKEEEDERAEALRRQKEQEERAEALRRQKEEEEKAEALRRQKEEEEKAEALRRQKEEEEKKELQKKIDEITNVLKPKAKIRDLLKKYEGQTIGTNHDSPTEIKGADLIKVGDDLFSILLADEKLIKSYPLRAITSIIEGVNGVSDGNTEEKSKFSIVILVHHPVL